MSLNHPTAESSVLGSVLCSDGQALDSCIGYIDGEAFTEPGYEMIYGAMLAVHATGRPVDLVTLEEALTQAGKLSEVGGVDQLSFLLESTISAANVGYHVDIVRKLWLKRRAVRETKRLQLALEDGDECLQQITRTTNALGLVVRHDCRNEGTDAVLREAFDDTQSDIQWCHPAIDRLTDRLKRGEGHVIAARPGNGKTSFIAEAARLQAHDGQRVGLASLEMPRARIMQKVIASETGTHIKEMGETQRADAYARMKNLLDTEWKDRFVVLDGRDGATNAFRVPHLFNAYELDVLYVDYIQYGLYSDSTRIEVARAMNMLKNLAYERNIAVVVASQLNRESVKREDIRPMLSDLKESGAVEEFACNTLLLHWPWKIRPMVFTPDEYEIIVGKARYGETGIVPYRFDGASCRFTAGDVEYAA